MNEKEKYWLLIFGIFVILMGLMENSGKIILAGLVITSASFFVMNMFKEKKK